LDEQIYRLAEYAWFDTEVTHDIVGLEVKLCA